jgi:hypothetical protein
LGGGTGGRGGAGLQSGADGKSGATWLYRLVLQGGTERCYSALLLDGATGCSRRVIWLERPRFPGRDAGSGATAPAGVEQCVAVWEQCV